MKKYIIFIILLLFVLENIFAQKKEEIFRVLHIENEIGCGVKQTAYANESIVRLIALGEDYVEEMFNLIEEETIGEDYSNEMITVLSFSKSKNDKKFIDYLESKIQTRNHPSQIVSIAAAFRIGGQPLKRCLDYLFSTDDFNFQVKILEKTWTLDELDNLLIIKASLDKVMSEHPEWKINKYIKNNYLHKFNFVLQVAKRENIPYLLEELKKIVNYKKTYFDSVPLGLWALKKMIEITPLEEQPALLKYLNDRRYISDKNLVPNEYIYFQFYCLNQPIAEKDRKALSPLEMAYSTGIVTFSILFRKAEEVRQYHSFREYVSSYKE